MYHLHPEIVSGYKKHLQPIDSRLKEIIQSSCGRICQKYDLEYPLEDMKIHSVSELFRKNPHYMFNRNVAFLDEQAIRMRTYQNSPRPPGTALIRQLEEMYSVLDGD